MIASSILSVASLEFLKIIWREYPPWLFIRRKSGDSSSNLIILAGVISPEGTSISKSLKFGLEAYCTILDPKVTTIKQLLPRILPKASVCFPVQS